LMLTGKVRRKHQPRFPPKNRYHSGRCPSRGGGESWLFAGSLSLFLLHC
jgi:hypothetical protein